jgi:hypothetical protein
MDTALFLTFFLFAVQISAGLAPLIWPNPEHAWIAKSIFWSSGLFAVICFLVWTQSMSLVPTNYVIAAGLLIAAGGFIWQQTKQPNPRPDIPAVAEVAQPAILKRQYFGRSKELFDENLTILTRALNGPGGDLIRKGREIVDVGQRTYYDPLPNAYEPTAQNLLKMRELYKEVKTIVWEKLRSEYPDQRADLDDIVGGSERFSRFEAELEKLYMSFGAFEVLLKNADPGVRSNAAPLYKALLDSFSTDLNNLYAWISECNAKIDEKRKALG